MSQGEEQAQQREPLGANKEIEPKRSSSAAEVFKSFLTYPFRLLIRVYQYVISPLIGPSCRFHPTCSAYAKQAYQRHGVLKGSWLSFRRIIRCHPWGGCGVDEVPK